MADSLSRNIPCRLFQEANQLAIYKRGRGVELGATERQLQRAGRGGLESRALDLKSGGPKHLIGIIEQDVSPMNLVQWP